MLLQHTLIGCFNTFWVFSTLTKQRMHFLLQEDYSKFARSAADKTKH